jgi:Kef-type K+ transport system membrane component KefB
MSFGTLALIGICGLVGPVASTVVGGAVPAVLGEILAGILIGRTGLQAIDPSNATLSFLADIGFAMLMFGVGMNIPLRDERVRASLPRGGLAAMVAGALAIAASEVVAQISGVGHPAVFAVIIGSGSAAVVLPIVQERRLEGEGILTVIAQVAVADVAATIAIPFVLRPGKAAEVAGGTAIIAATVIAVFALGRRLRRTCPVHLLRREGKHRRWAIDLRLALIVLFGLAWIAQATGTSVLIAGFGTGLMVAAIGGPKRLSTEVLGVGEGFFVPLFFVVLGSRIDLRGIAERPSMVGLALAVAGLTAAVHLLSAALTRQRPANGLLASAQLGVPSAIVALGLNEHVITSTQGAAIVLASLISLGVCALGAFLLERTGTPRARTVQQGTT